MLFRSNDRTGPEHRPYYCDFRKIFPFPVFLLTIRTGIADCQGRFRSRLERKNVLVFRFAANEMIAAEQLPETSRWFYRVVDHGLLSIEIGLSLRYAGRISLSIFISKAASFSLTASWEYSLSGCGGSPGFWKKGFSLYSLHRLKSASRASS